MEVWYTNAYGLDLMKANRSFYVSNQRNCETLFTNQIIIIDTEKLINNITGGYALVNSSNVLLIDNETNKFSKIKYKVITHPIFGITYDTFIIEHNCYELDYSSIMRKSQLQFMMIGVDVNVNDLKLVSVTRIV